MFGAQYDLIGVGEYNTLLGVPADAYIFGSQ